MLDKIALIGGCARLPIGFDAERALAEVAALPADHWGHRGGRVGVHNPAQAIFLRGHAPAEGELPVEDREVLDRLPTLRDVIERIVPAPSMRCLLALLPAGAVIAPHIDQADYFSKTLRLHFPLTSNEHVWMYSIDRCYRMRPGEIWALNNSARHGVVNADASESRLHMICDFLASPELLDLLARADRSLGRPDAEIERQMLAAPLPARRA
ncbi:aspartyl/asparaginyl beta-hydroxylase domain-containing protein [Dokdonella immobilis]|uniref:aspartyl/asparaginyl beta-hydroxylase domain-containing protein n=1 Tax=Dokdonella immobilis TaxID=578942 RepID=UPI001587ADD1|nr:aspartyl/asparaginyl beta-hydroxylase domain-containing protein [Dokdonella immobilis]